jgi:hypothetical protein
MALGRDVRKRIEAHRPLGVSGIKIADRMGAIGWNTIRHRLGKIAVGVDDGDTLRRHDVMHGQVEDHGALARARFADNVNMPLAVTRESPMLPQADFPMWCCSIRRGSPSANHKVSVHDVADTS